MARNKREGEPIPAHFKSVLEAGQFWDTHDLSDYWDLTKDAHFEVDIQKHVFLTSLEPELAKKLSDVARKQGISTETLINVWLSEKVAQAISGE